MPTHKSGEFSLIDRLRQVLGEPGEGEVWAGDDAAVLRAPAGTILFTADMLVEGIHFDLSLTGPQDLGYKAIAVNISDIAAMGGTPRRALVSLAVVPGIDEEWLLGLYEGMKGCADEFNMAIVGGDLSSSRCLTISVALIGNPAGRLTFERRGAKPGHKICVTGRLGASAAGYRLLRSGKREPKDLIDAHRRPVPRAREVQVIRRFLPSAMIDISDGFAADLGHICEASGTGAAVRLADLPLVDLTGIELDRTAEELGLHGGEDYELCFTIDPSRAEEVAVAVREATGTMVWQVGEIVAGDRMQIIDGSTTRELEARGWDHLSI